MLNLHSTIVVRYNTTFLIRLPSSCGRNISGKENSGVDPPCGFPVKAFVVRVIGHTWKTDHIVPWQVLKISNKAPITVPFSEDEKRNYSVKLGKTPDCCKILTAQLNGLYCVASSVKIRRKTYFLPGTAWRTACHGILSNLSITHGNHMKGLGLLTFIRILFLKCVDFLTLGYFRNVSVGKLTWAQHQ